MQSASKITGDGTKQNSAKLGTLFGLNLITCFISHLCFNIWNKNNLYIMYMGRKVQFILRSADIYATPLTYTANAPPEDTSDYENP